MAIKIEMACKAKEQCKFGGKCLLMNPIKVYDVNDAGGDFSPVLKIRFIKRDLQLRCFSFAEESRR